MSRVALVGLAIELGTLKGGLAMKKIVFLGIFLVLSISLGVQACASNGTYKDVYESDWFVDDVRYVHNLALMEGADGEFSPSAYATRGEIIEALYHLEGSPAVSEEVKFTDLPVGSKNFSAVSWAVENNIINGYGNGWVGANDNVTREQLVTILNRYAVVRHIEPEAKADLSRYKDLDKVSNWAMDAFSWSNAIGLIKGTSDTTLSPKGTTTRAEVSAVIHRLGLLVGINYPNDSFIASTKEPVFVLVEESNKHHTEVCGEVYTSGGITSYTYDKAGEYTGKKMCMWNTGSYVECYFNSADQIIRASEYTTHTGEPILVEDIWYTYDECGKLASGEDTLSSWSKTYTTTYDEKGRTKTTTVLIPSDLYGAQEEELTYYYTDTGYYTTWTFMVGWPAKARVTTSVYDLDGRLISRFSSIDGAVGPKTDYTYDDDGRLMSEHYSMPESLDNYTTFYMYNDRGILVGSIVQGTHYGEPYYQNTIYINTYDEYGNLISQYEDKFGVTTTYVWKQIA